MKEGFILRPPCGDNKPGGSQPRKGPSSAQGMVFNAGMTAMNKQPGIKLAKTLNAAANNKNITQPAALSAVALAGAAGMGGTAGNVMNTMNKANRARNVMKQIGGRRSKSRRRRR